MNLIILYHRCVHVLVMLGVLAYSVAEERMIHALAAAPVIAAAYLIAGGPRGRPAPPWVVNLALLAATVGMAFNWSGSLGDTVSVLCAYIVWLQLIKLFEPRTPRDRAQVIALSAMLVIGACLTAATPELGAVLLIYLPVLLATVMLHQVYVAAWIPPRAPAADAPHARPIWRRALAWTLGHAEPSPAPACLAAVDTGRNAPLHLGMSAAACGVAVVGLAIAVYLLFPRDIGKELLGPWRPPRASSVTGFRDHVQLGAPGAISESQRVVMRLRVESPADPIPAGRLFRLRGAVLDEYDPLRGTWRQSRHAESYERRGSTRAHPEMPDDLPEGPRLTIHAAIIDRPLTHLFTRWMPLWIGPDGPTEAFAYRFNSLTRTYTLPPRRGSISYRVICAPQAEAPPPRAPRHDPPAPPPPQFQSGPIHELARSILERARITIDEDNPRTRARAAEEFERYLRGTCVYTTQVIAPAPGQDPIEAFLFDEDRGRRGHCEYFASAMAALCLSVGIPARVATGYVASEFDPDTETYTVRENHAHAWNEVEIRLGWWREYDPSPAEDVQRLHHPAGAVRAMMRRVMDALQAAWSAGVVAFDRDSQLGALRAFSIVPLAALRALNAWIAGLVDTERTLAEENRAMLLARLSAWVVLFASAAIVLAHLLFGLLRWSWRRWARDASAAHPDSDPLHGEITALYRRTLAALARAGAAKPAWTPALAHTDTLTLHRPELARHAAGVVRLYYRVKFGDDSPARADLASAAASVRALEHRAGADRRPKVRERPERPPATIAPIVAGRTPRAITPR